MKNEFVVWQKKWLTGIKKIDEQHQHFVGILNRAYLINKDKKDKEVLIILLNDLLEYARVHFSTEEGYFEDTDYPDKEEHMERHQALLTKVINFSQRLSAEENSNLVIKELLIFLKGWLDDHLVQYDHKYIPWLTEHGVK
jgi:hemerythrin